MRSIPPPIGDEVASASTSYDGEPRTEASPQPDDSGHDQDRPE